MTSRTPPIDVRRILRKEVNFGCPVEGCGVPYLTWHHFDPPWREEEHHNPEGMIALCPLHAGLADGGRWTNDQLREMKEKPYVSLDEISGKYDYLRRDVVSVAGCIFFGVQNIIEIDGERIIGFERDSEGYIRLNLLLKTDKDEIILKMENNDWVVFRTDLFELICTAQGKEIRIRSGDNTINFQMRFDDYSNDEFRSMLRSRFSVEASRQFTERYLAMVEKETGEPHPFHEKLLENSSHSSIDRNMSRFLERIGNPESIPTWTLEGTVTHNGKTIQINDTEIVDLTSGSVFYGSFFLNKKSAISHKEGNLLIGTSK